MTLFIVVGVATTTPLFLAALASAKRIWGRTTVERSNFIVYTRFVMMLAKVSRICVRDISSSALGTTESTSEEPSASMSVMSGATTVVFPAPMIICFTLLPPFLTILTKFRTISICFLRRRMFHTNSNMRKRGSKDALSPSRSVKCRRPARNIASVSPACIILGSSVSSVAPGAKDCLRVLMSDTAALMHRFTCPSLLARSIVIGTSCRMASARSSGMYGFIPLMSSTPLEESSASKRNSGHASAAWHASRLRTNSMRAFRPLTPAPPTSM
mmetsp:Transcript_24231/g.49041  ORF Transcript_24231/g.49041 Transcript_24231/m.49041 type:complete len:271 (+) Transcript_24231:473-1285(+)